jgi:2,4-didehydro-3-deoxy-L-rhamnonate hydrolase
VAGRAGHEGRGGHHGGPGGVAMRLCRFNLDDLILTGFYADDRVIPIDQAAEAYCDEAGVELLLPSTSEILDLVPPDGPYFDAVRELASWVEQLDVAALDELAVSIEEVQLLVPIDRPNKLLLLAGNYAEHIVERGGTSVEREETFPYVFMKPPTTTLTNPGDPVILPKVSPDHIDWECELGVVIGRTCRQVDEAEALAYVAGYTVVNDISDRKFKPNPARKARDRDRFFDWQHGKWHDTFCPMGPCLLTADAVADPQALALRLTVNDDVKQDASTAQMIFPVAAVVSFLSQFVTLEPGDIISTGTPSGVGSSTGTYLRPGDTVRATISGIGTLENPVEAEDS